MQQHDVIWQSMGAIEEFANGKPEPESLKGGRGRQ
jgi:hypothetical protein